MQDKSDIEGTTVEVSVICITYNHKRYINQCLSSLVRQKVNFHYEIVVHDDASSDGTQEIIREFQKRYPDKMKVICQSENQYSQGRKPGDIAISQAKGDYIAFCEGDDFWCDDGKLQAQYDYMCEHSGCSLCFHDVQCLDEACEQKASGNWTFWDKSVFKGAGKYTPEELMRLAVVPASSMFYRRKDNDYMILFSKRSRYGDMIRTMHLATVGHGYCMEKKMSVYRKNVPNSVMTKDYQNVRGYNNSLLAAAETMSNFDEYHCKEYHEIISPKIEQLKSRLIKFHIQEIENMCKNCNKVYIYGTEVYGKLCYKELENYGEKVAGFVVSDAYYKEDVLLTKRVYSYSSVKGDGVGFLIAVGNGVREQIVSLLKEENQIFCIGIDESVQKSDGIENER